MTPKATKKKAVPKAQKLNLETEVSELQILLRALGEEAVMMRDGGKLAEKEKTYFGDIVTEADTLVEKEIVKHIQNLHPTHSIRGEQGTHIVGDDGIYEWIIDPIDGTTNFSKGSDFFAMSVGLLEHGKPVMGMLYFPSLSRSVHAIKGKGAFENGHEFKIYQRNHPKEMRKALIAGAITRGENDRSAALTHMRLGSVNLVNTGAMTFNCILVAERKIDAAVHTDATPFDIAAAIIIVEESGGFVTGIGSDYPDLSQSQIPVVFASTKELANDIRKQLHPHLKD